MDTDRGAPRPGRGAFLGPVLLFDIPHSDCPPARNEPNPPALGRPPGAKRTQRPAPPPKRTQSPDRALAAPPKRTQRPGPFRPDRAEGRSATIRVPGQNG